MSVPRKPRAAKPPPVVPDPNAGAPIERADVPPAPPEPPEELVDLDDDDLDDDDDLENLSGPARGIVQLSERGARAFSLLLDHTGRILEEAGDVAPESHPGYGHAKARLTRAVAILETLAAGVPDPE